MQYIAQPIHSNSLKKPGQLNESNAMQWCKQLTSTVFSLIHSVTDRSETPSISMALREAPGCKICILDHRYNASSEAKQSETIIC